MESAEGQGSAFSVHLPTVGDSVAPKAPTEVLDYTAQGVETIILVEDQNSVREVIYEVLTENGYLVTKAVNGKEAIEIAYASSPFNMLITDVVMPSMSGREVATEIQRLHPGIKVLYISGYSDDVVLKHGVEESSMNLLQKPFTPQALLEKVRQILDLEKTLRL